MASKVIVTGAIEGRFEVFEKLSKLHAKNAFSFAVVLGDLFADPSVASTGNEESLSLLLNGKITVPLPTYFTLGKNALPSRVLEKLESGDGDVCQNLYFLGKRSTTKTTEGLRIVALGGSLDANLTTVSKDKFLPFHTEGDAKALHGANNADILVTSRWPTSIQRNSGVRIPEGFNEPVSEQCVADLCSALKPRYHFSTSKDFFHEREPFFHLTQDGDPDTESVTRFLSLAAFGNPDKQKWLYAFSIDPNATPPVTLPAGITASPLTASRKRSRLPDQEHAFSRFGGASHGHNNHHHKAKRHKAPPPGPQECFFCLSNPNSATHLITSIGDDVYLTTAKGPLSTGETYDSLEFPAHILIIPLSHSPTIASITPPETKESTFNEMTRFRNALQTLVGSSSKGTLGAVTWEVSRAEGIHIHWQFLPVPADLVERGLVEAAFKVEAENEKYPAFLAKQSENTGEQGDSFRVWIWSPKKVDDGDEGAKGLDKEMLLPLSSEFRFDLQFGRRVMAKLLGLEKRLQWRDCSQDEEEEKQDAEAFKAAFKEFDFSVEET